MSKVLANTVLSAMKSTAILVCSFDATEDKVHVYNANNVYDRLASVSIEYDELFAEYYYFIVPSRNYGGFKKVAKTIEELKHAIETLNGYPTDADNRRNHSRAVYRETSY